MINDDILIKYARSRGHRLDWPEQVNRMKNRLTEVKLGFPGLGNDHLSIVEYKKVVPGDIIIYDTYIESCEIDPDEAPIMLNIISEDKGIIEGIGIGYDKLRDPDRLLYRWKDTIDLPNISDNSLVYKVDVRPDLNGGPGYYYFFKAFRDYRY